MPQAQVPKSVAVCRSVAGMTALALGALLRNTAAAITTFVAVFFVIPTLTLLLARLVDRHPPSSGRRRQPCCVTVNRHAERGQAHHRRAAI